MYVLIPQWCLVPVFIILQLLTLKIKSSNIMPSNIAGLLSWVNAWDTTI